MENSILIAKIISLAYLFLGIGLLTSSSFYEKLFQTILKNPPFLLMSSILSLIVGMILLANHNTWEAHWTTLITIVGWLALLKGFFLLSFPRAISFLEPLLKCKKLPLILTPFVLALGLLFGYFGFCTS